MIRIRRSESTVLKFRRTQTDGTVILTPPDDLWFSMKKQQNDKHCILQKKLSDGGISFDAETGWYRIEFFPKDTDPLDFGVYYFDIKKLEGNREKFLTKTKSIEIYTSITGLMRG